MNNLLQKYYKYHKLSMIPSAIAPAHSGKKRRITEQPNPNDVIRRTCWGSKCSAQKKQPTVTITNHSSVRMAFICTPLLVNVVLLYFTLRKLYTPDKSGKFFSDIILLFFFINPVE